MKHARVETFGHVSHTPDNICSKTHRSTPHNSSISFSFQKEKTSRNKIQLGRPGKSGKIQQRKTADLDKNHVGRFSK